MKRHIIAARQESQPVLEEASTLLVRKRESEEKRQLLDAFCRHFLISDTDLDTLTNTTLPVEEHFFTVLNRVKQIHRDCELLLGSENQRLGLELMEQTRRNLDAGFKKLYTWIQREFKGLDLEDPYISGSIRRALRVLSERPTLFQNCLDFFGQARESTLFDAFQTALTGTDSGQAIEFSTHDPLRYIGDMLAWMHSAAVSEKEALEGLFISDADEISKGLAAGQTSEPWARIRSSSVTIEDRDEDDTETTFDGRKALSNLISRNLVTVSQSLQQRIELVIQNNDEPVLLYKIYNLLCFYQDIFTKLVGQENAIYTTIGQLQTSTLERFEEVMEEENATAKADTTPASNLTPPAHFQSALKQFSDIARVRGPQMTTSELEKLFSAVLGALLDACAEGAMQLVDIRESNIYKLNYLNALQTTFAEIITQIPNVSIPLEKARSEIISLRHRTTETIATTLLDESGVGSLLQEIDSRKDKGERRKWLEANLEEAAQKLDDFLSSGLMDAQDSQRRIIDKVLAKEIIVEAVQRFCSEFDELETILEQLQLDTPLTNHEREDDEGPVTLRDLYPRTGAEVRALLS